MPRLAIVIPAMGSAERLEATLVSVLQNRPRDCEVLVAASVPYDDPYQLAGEIGFLADCQDLNYSQCVNQALQATQAEVVHVLADGCEVDEGWTDAALDHFRDPRIAVVAPLVLRADQPQRVLAAGISYRSGGSRRQATAKRKRIEQAGPHRVLGACGFAGFYRRETIEAVGGWPADAGTALADIELALLLRHAGYQGMCEPASRVYASQQPLPVEGAFRQGLTSERVFWRNAGSFGWGKALLSHPFVVAADTLAHLTSPAVVLRLAGRLWACCQVGSYVRHYHRLRSEWEPADVVRLSSAPGTRRIDAGHDDLPQPSGGGSRRMRSA